MFSPPSHFCALQGYHDPSRTKILHFSMNPASLAKQQRQEEMANLREECERLRERLRVLESGDAGGTSSSSNCSGKLEGGANLQSHPEIAGRTYRLFGRCSSTVPDTVKNLGALNGSELWLPQGDNGLITDYTVLWDQR
ncbi:hypothetical protein Chor_015322 [Crotalus horridus]